MTESPQEHVPNQEMASSINTDSVLIPDNIPEQSNAPELDVPEQSVPEPDVPELSVSEQVFSNQSPATNTFAEPEITSTNDQPSSSSLVIQPVAPAKTNVPSPPTLFLNSTILANVCEDIFQELNNLVQARNNLIHEDNYEKMWTRLKDRVEFVLSELQRTCFDAQEIA